jgi:hypothetical protein
VSDKSDFVIRELHTVSSSHTQNRATTKGGAADKGIGWDPMVEVLVNLMSEFADMHTTH